LGCAQPGFFALPSHDVTIATATVTDCLDATALWFDPVSAPSKFRVAVGAPKSPGVLGMPPPALVPAAKPTLPPLPTQTFIPTPLLAGATGGSTGWSCTVDDDELCGGGDSGGS
jgi:hypothetical protein